MEDDVNSPFPGMDPYLERHWGDVHTSLIVYSSNQINEQLPDNLYARIEEIASVTMYEDEPRTERHIEIIDAGNGGRVVTAIEFLSPANKVGVDGRLAYKPKQREYLEGGVNLVEIDLVREGEHVLAVPQERIPSDYRTPYLVCVRRAAREHTQNVGDVGTVHHIQGA